MGGRRSAKPKAPAEPTPGELTVAELLGMAAPYNPRQISDADFAALRRSIRYFGFVEPVVVNRRSGCVIGGHQRIRAASEEGVVSVPVMFVDLDDPSERQLNVALNRISGEWDDAKLRELLAELDDSGADLTLTGFDADELGTLLARAAADERSEGAGEGDDEIPEPPADPISRPGEIWELGAHRLICGDATDADVVALLMEGERAALCFTSPPYGNQRDYTVESDLSDWDALMRGVFAALPMDARGQVLVNLGLVHRDQEVVPYWDGWLQWMRGQGWRRFGWYVWDQGPGMPGDTNGRLGQAFEFVFHFNRETRAPNKITPCKHAGELYHQTPGTGQRDKDGSVKDWHAQGQPTQDFRVPDSLIRVMRQKGSIGDGIDHPAVFPVGLPLHLIEAYTSPGELIFEPFSGSGTSLIAAERSGRIARAVEIAPAYVDVALIRFARTFPGLPIRLAGTGRTFEDMAASRGRAEKGPRGALAQPRRRRRAP